MNLTLTPESIKLIGVLEDNQTIVIQDNIGFSTANLDSGFNYSDAGTPFVDGLSNGYPNTDEVVFFLQAWHIPFDDALNTDPEATGTALTVSRVRDAVLPAIDTATGTDPGFVYGDNLNEFRVVAPKDGWIELRLFALDVDVSGDAYYYNSADDTVRLVADDSVETDLSVVAAAVGTTEISLLKTSILDENIAYVEKCYTQARMRGQCKDEDEWRKHIMILQVGRVSAKIEFDSYGNRFMAQQIIEYLETYLNKNDLEKPNN